MADGSCNVAVLVSGNGSNLQSIIDHVRQGRVNANVACVISNNKNAHGLIRATRAHVPVHVVEHARYPSREAFDTELVATLSAYDLDLVFLAGFMRILSKVFIDEYQNRILNVHPSLLPKFPGLHTHRRVHEAGEAEHGCSVHFVTLELDDGPLVIQARIPVKDSDDPESLARRLLDKEHTVCPLAIKWFSEGRLSCIDETAYFDDKPLLAPMLLAPEHEAELQ